jgi:hypothetical protein
MSPLAHCRRASDPYARSKALPDMLDLDDDPQLGPVAVLQVALDVAIPALESRHAYFGELTDAVLDSPDSPVLLLQRLAVNSCAQLRDVLKAYRVAVAQAAEREEHDTPDSKQPVAPDDLPF